MKQGLIDSATSFSGALVYAWDQRAWRWKPAELLRPDDDGRRNILIDRSVEFSNAVLYEFNNAGISEHGDETGGSEHDN